MSETPGRGAKRRQLTDMLGPASPKIHSYLEFNFWDDFDRCTIEYEGSMTVPTAEAMEWLEFNKNDQKENSERKNTK